MHPTTTRPAPTSRTAGLLLAGVAGLAAVTLAGCGSTGAGSSAGSAGGSASSSPSSSPSDATPSPSAGQSGDCPADTRGPSARVDVDGDGEAEQVRPTASSCGAGVVATSGSRTWAASASGSAGTQEPPVEEVYGVRVPGRAAQLVVTRSTHPRGGEQLRVYAAQGDRLVELRRGTEPLVPFTATDVQEQPASIACGKDSLVLTVAVAHEPPGVVAAWDVRRTAYTLGEGARLEAGPTREVADNVLPGKLRTEWPALVRHQAFAGCRVG